MQYPIDSAPWRQNFVAALQLLARAAMRQPLGPPDPVLCGDAAVRLYTGDLWCSGCIEVFAADAWMLIICTVWRPTSHEQDRVGSVAAANGPSNNEGECHSNPGVRRQSTDG